MIFAFLLLVTLGNSHFFSSKKENSAKLATQALELQKQQELKQQKHQAKPEKLAKVNAWKETEYQHYTQSRREQLQAKQQEEASAQSEDQVAGLDPARKPAKKAKSDKIEYVKVPYNGSYILVSRDYYKVDGKRMPLTRKQAEQIARKHGAVLPTKEMVDAIWQHADLKLQPQPLQPGPQMTRQAYFDKHDNMIERQIGNRSFKLVAGHKKDIIRSQRNGRVTIYGWQRSNGKPIQPVSSVHDDRYVDYSNCLRLVKIPS
jgi:hypothetical protein